MKNKFIIFIFVFLIVFIPFRISAKNKCNIVSGNGQDIGSEIDCAGERFYVVENKENSIRMLAKYNLDIGSVVNKVTVSAERYNEIIELCNLRPYCNDLFNEPEFVGNKQVLSNKSNDDGTHTYYILYNLTLPEIKQNILARGVQWDARGNPQFPEYGVIVDIPTTFQETDEDIYEKYYIDFKKSDNIFYSMYSAEVNNTNNYLEYLQSKYEFNYYSTFSNAINDVSDNSIGINVESNKDKASIGVYTNEQDEVWIVLLEDIKIERTSIDVDVNINLAGHKISVESTTDNAVVFDIYSNVIIDGSINGSGIYAKTTAGKARCLQLKTGGKLIINGGSYIADAYYEANVLDSIAVSVNANSTLIANNCYMYGTHSALQNKGTVYIDGGIYESFGHGGIYMAGNGYIKNATIRECDVHKEFADGIKTNGNGAAMYIGGSGTKNKEIYIDNCEIYSSSKQIILRGTSNEKNNTLYISNSKLYGLDSGSITVRIDNDTHKLYIGTGNNFEATNTDRESVVILTDETYAKNYSDFTQNDNIFYSMYTTEAYNINNYLKYLQSKGIIASEIDILTVKEISNIVYNITNSYLPLEEWGNTFETKKGTIYELRNYYLIGSIKEQLHKEGYEWLYATTYWTRTAKENGSKYFYIVDSLGNLSNMSGYDIALGAGIRPVIEISKDIINYNLMTETDSNGKIEIATDIEIGDTIVLTATPKNGYKLAKLIVKTESGKTIEVTRNNIIENNDGTISINPELFTMPVENVVIEAMFEIINPKTGILNVITILFVGFIISVSGFFLVKKYNERYEF